MNTYTLFGLITISILFASCQETSPQERSEEGVWKLGWSIYESMMAGNYELAESRFDSLLSIEKEVDYKFLVTGLEVKSELGKEEEMVEILNAQSQEMLNQLCQKPFLSPLAPCENASEEIVENPTLQVELIRMYVDDQAARGNLMEDIISKYDLDTAEVTKDGAVGIDQRNRERLREIFDEYGFPTRKLIGKDAMFGVFLMIQHADGDIEWQKSQLENIRKAVENGDLEGQSYAYLYDRIRVNSGEKQLYGTQFAKVDPINKTVELAEIEDAEHVNQRRREMGMMPIGIYNRLMLKSLQ